jgi:sporadic carbohydrate cluster 2OG-Fe(II) oxygenase
MYKNNFLSHDELKYSKDFIKNGFIIKKVDNRINLLSIEKIIKSFLKKNNFVKSKSSKLNLNLVHKYLNKDNLNDLRLKLINEINNKKNFKTMYYNLAKTYLDAIVGNELAMQKRINLSIQLPKDDTSLLPIHSDTWSGDSPYEVVLWVPLVNCYKSKSMYILPPKYLNEFHKYFQTKNSSSVELYKKIKKKVVWLNVKYGEILIFNQNLPHGNIVNAENETRWSFNCRFKNIFTPYGDKKIGEFFEPITLKPVSQIAMKYKYPNEA